MFKVLIIPYYMSSLFCTSCQAPYGSILFASCNRFHSVDDQFGRCDAMWFVALADVHGDSDYVRKECRVLQGRDVKALSEQRQSNMQVWNCTACGTCAQIGCISSRVWAIRCLSRSSNANILDPHVYSSSITYYNCFRHVPLSTYWYLTCVMLPGKEGISFHTPYVPSKHDSSIQMSGTASDLWRKGHLWNYKFSSKWERLIDGHKATTQSFLPQAPMNFQRFLKFSYHSPSSSESHKY